MPSTIKILTSSSHTTWISLITSQLFLSVGCVQQLWRYSAREPVFVMAILSLRLRLHMEVTIIPVQVQIDQLWSGEEVVGNE